MAVTKGERVRLVISPNTGHTNNVIAGAKSLQLHISCQTEETTTKDTVGSWTRTEVTGISYEIQTDALIASGEPITSTVKAVYLDDLVKAFNAGESDTDFDWKIVNTSGANNRTQGTTIVSGRAILTQLTINGPNRQLATYSARFNGYGDYN